MDYFEEVILFFIFFSLSLTVLHTGKRWFIICPVAETPVLDKEKDTSHTSTAEGKPHTQEYRVLLRLHLYLQIYYLLNEFHQMRICSLCLEWIVYRINWIVCVWLADVDSKDAAHAMSWGQLYKSASAVVLGRYKEQDLYSNWQSLMGQDKQWCNTLAPTGPSSCSSWLSLAELRIESKIISPPHYPLFFPSRI